MRRLSLLLLAFALALAGLRLLSDDDFAAYLLRDGLILSLLAALLFTRFAPPFPRSTAPSGLLTWPFLARLLVGVGIACLALATFLSLLGDMSIPFRALHITLWLLGILLLTVGAFWPAGERKYRRPAYRWQRDAAGRFVRLALVGADDHTATAPAKEAIYPVALLFIIAAGAFLRLWRLADLPAGCIDAECLLGLQLMDDQATVVATPGLFFGLAQLIHAFTDASVTSLRIASAVLGILTLPVFYAAARRYTRAGGALIAALALALLPWHIWASRSSQAWIALPLLISFALWATAHALQSSDRRWWTIAGIAFGLLWIEAVPLGMAVFFWLVLTVLIGLTGSRRAQAASRFWWLTPLIGLAIALAVALPALASTGSWVGRAMDGARTAALDLLSAALRHVPDELLGLAVDHSALGIVVAALAILGLIYQLRYVDRRRHASVLGGFAALAAGIVWLDHPQITTASGLLVLLPFLLLAAAIALDQILFVFQEIWQPLVRPARVTLAAWSVVLLLGLTSATQLLANLATIQAGRQDSMQEMMGRTLAERLRSDTTGATIYFVPPGVLEAPATQLLAGAALDDARIRPLNLARELPYPGVASGDLSYFVPVDEPLLLELLNEFYPDAATELIRGDDQGPPLFTIFTVARQQIVDSQGIDGALFAGDDLDADQPPLLTTVAGPLEFAWRDDPPAAGPFHVRWQGTLLAPAAGNYSFGVNMDDSDAIVSLRLDDEIVLDTSLGLTERDYTLAEGAYRLDLSYRTASQPGNWSVTWERPGGELEVIPRTVLRSPPLPNMGLFGTYFAGDRLLGPVLTVRKDLLVGADADLPWPYSAHWEGKLAASRAGEYRFSVLADGVAQIFIDDQMVVNHPPAPVAGDAPVTADGVIYLDQAWHDIDVHFVPDSRESALRPLWQPPGSNPGALPSRYLAPVLVDLQPGDLELPPAPELVDPRLGDDTFALTYGDDHRQAQIVIPPGQLPPFSPELVWQIANGCGAGPAQLDWPHGVAINLPEGRMFVADTGNKRVVEVRLDGEVAKVYQEPAFEEPFDVTISRDGALLVLDSVAQQIFRIDPSSGSATGLASDTGFYHPRGFGVDEMGNIFVADTGGARVAMLDPAGNYVVGMGGVDTGLGRGQPVDTLAAGDTGWTVTAEDGRIWRLDIAGSLIAMPRSTTLDGPHLAGLPDGSFFISDPTRQSIFYYSKIGQPLRQWAYAGAFETPTGVAVGVDEAELLHIAVVDSSACSLSLWRLPATNLNADLLSE